MENFNKQTGAGLVSAIMAVALLAVGSVIVLRMIGNVSKVRKAVELRADATLLKKNLLTSTDCKAIPVCQGNQLRALTDFDGQVIVNSSGTTKFGQWTVQARCQPNQNLEVRVALLDAKGNPAKDPLKGKLMDWQAPEGILIESGILCGAVITDFSQTQQFTVQTSNVCEPAQGTCPAPPESAIDVNASDIMCCEDGRDAVRPHCPGMTQEIAAYWDRQEDWGMGGQWVVLCQ